MTIATTNAASSLPEWATWIQALGPTASSLMTASIAAAVAAVAFMQWRTAHTKLVLDLFDRRYQVYADASTALELALRDGDVKNNESMRKMWLARGRAEFLFAADITNYLKGLQLAQAELGLANDMMRAQDVKDDWPKRAHTASLQLINAYEKELAPKFAPYLKMTQKL